MTGNKSHYHKQYKGYLIHLEGTETQTVTYINANETTTKSYTWDRNYSVVVYKDGTINRPNKKDTYFQVEAKK